MTEFSAIFDANYRKMEKTDMKLPPEILAFKLLKKANITKEEKLLVLTDMDYTNKNTLYEQAKTSFKTFKGGVCEGSLSSSQSIKFEPAFLAEHEEALLAAGYTLAKSVYNKRGNWRGGRGGGREGSQKRNLNPVGVDDRLLRCRSCGPFGH
ncbi:hypothetical protein DPMN_052062 [Dreissena polymorpha]|uniref:Uncharacterized protein n=1 Tax=Dreissena polymorpha TaxID=45954 RepID=A0A9D4HPJ6_DREPO|nr:hypothetical protein DPMN_052062 [Dreissena polymorpha]